MIKSILSIFLTVLMFSSVNFALAEETENATITREVIFDLFEGPEVLKETLEINEKTGRYIGRLFDFGNNVRVVGKFPGLEQVCYNGNLEAVIKKLQKYVFETTSGNSEYEVSQLISEGKATALISVKLDSYSPSLDGTKWLSPCEIVD